jgi:hypothetical protein
MTSVYHTEISHQMFQKVAGQKKTAEAWLLLFLGRNFLLTTI